MAPSRVDSSFSAEATGFAGGGGEGEDDGEGAEEEEVEEGAEEPSLGRATERRAASWCCWSWCGW